MVSAIESACRHTIACAGAKLSGPRNQRCRSTSKGTVIRRPECASTAGVASGSCGAGADAPLIHSAPALSFANQNGSNSDWLPY